MLNIKILGPGCANCFILKGLTIAMLGFMTEDGSAASELENVTFQHLS